MLTLERPDEQRWGALLASRGSSPLLQLPAYGRLKQGYGCQSLRLALVGPDGALRCGAQLLLHQELGQTLPVAYLPHGPVGGDPEERRQLLTVIVKELGGRCGLLRWEPPWLEGDPRGGTAAAWGLQEVTGAIQPPRTLVLDLSGDEAAWLARMKPATRRGIRRAAHLGVRLRRAEPAELPAFTALMAATAARQAFTAHPAGYYADTLRWFGQPGSAAALLLAEAEQGVLAGALMVSCGATAFYLHAASSDLGRHCHAPQALVLACMRWARDQGCRLLDLWGVPDRPLDQLEAQVGRRHDGLWGVYRFKRGFGGRLQRRAGTWERALS